MYVNVQQTIPGCGPVAVHVHLRLTVTPEGPASLHWTLEDVETEQPLAIGAVLRQTLQDVELIAPAVLEECLRVGRTLADPDPFPAC